MRCKSEFAERPLEAFVEKVSGNANIWVRTNIVEEEREDGVVFIADEAFMKMPEEDAPTVEEIVEDIESWFEYASEYQEAKEITIDDVIAKLDYISIMVGGN